MFNILMKTQHKFLAASVLFGVAALAVSAQNPHLKTASHVNLERYLGKWYEIAAIPQWFEKGCACTTANYSLNTDGTIMVTNTCIKEGKTKIAVGKAFVTDKKTNAKLSVQFFWPFRGKYWIIDLDSDYNYVLVGHPNRKYLWILSRKPRLDQQSLNRLLSVATNQGFDTTQLVFTKQQNGNKE
jgi:apolipoprotein D and lipocalin family protein